MNTVFDDIKRRLTPRKQWIWPPSHPAKNASPYIHARFAQYLEDIRQGPRSGYEYCGYIWWLKWVNYLQDGESSLEGSLELAWLAKFCDRPTFVRFLAGKA